MILQALNDYYERKRDDLPPDGWISKGADFAVVLDKDGVFVDLHCLQEAVGKKIFSRKMFLPNIGKQSLKHSNSSKDANLLWDNSAFVFGLGGKADLKIGSFIETIEEYFPQNLDEGIIAILKFLKRGKGDRSLFSPILRHTSFGETISTGNPIILFRLIKDHGFVFERPEVFSVINNLKKEDKESYIGFCPVSGKVEQNIELTHTVIKGVRDAQTSGASIVSFNKDAFCSYGKSKAANAPVSKVAAQQYVKSLNYLLRAGSSQKLQVGDATTVFWSDKSSNMEDDFAAYFDEPIKDNPNALSEKVRQLLIAVDKGVLPLEDDQTRFFILGLSPNSARISVRFWHTGTVAEFSAKIARHFVDLAIVHAPHQREHLSIWWLLNSIATQGKSENIPPNLAGEWMRSILIGGPYPKTLLHAAIRRIKAEREVSYERAAIVKACLNRELRFQTQSGKEITVSLDKQNTNPGYCIGRLFALLEKIQEEASPSLNTTIRDRYYSAASGTPASVLPILMRMKNHHLGKLEKGRGIYFEKLLQEIFGQLQADGFPSLLSLDDQGRFAIGYYHQRQAFYVKSDKFDSQPTEQGPQL
ncbi:type I-C CRISPR-associated protein Cas8c/Csd1 [Rheinheimera sediminis]|uniref:type I-C CRISPR-associated protein Cas8c/Csd1 n=1 Tax=Rheinheimera sp. YQF-1 TaxID=2499626 RepID=UPI000FDC281B|nr:type I-C CRISPR-associated protein Cas8c/Csd1 [Rheinheimera sp. YQF-1]RVT40633.1 type I-C CRISPR-associated protein Cas8c/Csd1 [Rheinheimera sp. YQF-1]